MTRHKASHEQRIDVSVSPVSSRACKQCALDRVRCSKSLPCRRCSERQLTCCFPAGGKGAATGSNGQHETSQLLASLTSDIPEALPRDFDAPSEEHDYAQTSLLPGAVEQGGPDAAPSNTLSNSAGAFTTWNDPFGDFTNLCDVDLPGLGSLGINWISPGYQYDLDWDSLPNPSATATQTVQSSPSADLPAVGIGLRTNSHGQDLQRILQTSPSSNTVQTCNSAQSKATPGSAGGEYYVDGDGSRAPFGGRYHDRGSVAHSQALQARFHDSARSSVASRPPVSTELCSIEAYNSLIQCLMHQSHLIDLGIDITKFPSCSQIEIWVQQYFEKFHPIFPFLRRASFREKDSHGPLLLLAVAAAGSKYAHRSQEPRDALCPILDTVLRQHRREALPMFSEGRTSDIYVPGQLPEPENPTDFRDLQADVINTILLLQSGRTALLETALHGYHHLVRTCNSLGLLEWTLVRSGDDEQLQDWLKSESRTRTGWMIWVTILHSPLPLFLLMYAVSRFHDLLRIQYKTLDGTRQC